MRFMKILGLVTLGAVSTLGMSNCMNNGTETVGYSNISFAGWKRVALKINNHTNNPIKYFYSSHENNGQTRWYEHSVGSGSSSWDWTMCSASWKDCIEFEIPKNDGFEYIVIVTQLDEAGNAYLETYTTHSDKDNNPLWNDNIWNLGRFNPDRWDGINWHAHIDFVDY